MQWISQQGKTVDCTCKSTSAVASIDATQQQKLFLLITEHGRQLYAIRHTQILQVECSTLQRHAQLWRCY